MVNTRCNGARVVALATEPATEATTKGRGRGRGMGKGRGRATPTRGGTQNVSAPIGATPPPP